MDRYRQANLRLWEEWAALHPKTDFYQLDRFKSGWNSLRQFEMQELGEVSGRSLLHLQCHFGLDTLSWARLGASVTGADFSSVAIETARSLASELGIEARFVVSELYDLPNRLDGRFDVVYTSLGVLNWLPDIEGWAGIVDHFLRSGGIRSDRVYHWQYSLGDIVSAVAGRGLRIEFLHEYPFTRFKWASFIELRDDGNHWLAETIPGELPMIFTLRATKPA